MTDPDTPAQDPDFGRLPVWTRGPSQEAFTAGTVLTHHWGRTFDSPNSALFSAITHMWGVPSLDSGSTREPELRERINPFLVLCTVFGLSVEDLSESRGPFLSLTECEFHADVFAGDSITASSTVLESRASKQRAGTQIVTWRTDGRNQRGDLVLSYVRSNLVGSLGGGSDE